MANKVIVAIAAHVNLVGYCVVTSDCKAGIPDGFPVPKSWD